VNAYAERATRALPEPRTWLGQDIVAYSSEFKVDYVFLILAELIVYALVVSIVFSVIGARLLKWRQ